MGAFLNIDATGLETTKENRNTNIKNTQKITDVERN